MHDNFLDDFIKREMDSIIEKNNEKIIYIFTNGWKKRGRNKK